MTIPNDHSQQIDEDQAALWAARLDGSTLTAADHVALDAWLAGDPARRALLSRYCQFGVDLERQIPALVAAGDLILPSFSEPRRYRGRLLRWGLPVSLAAAAAVAVMVWVGRTPTQATDFATPLAQRQTLAFADGTEAELNAQTSLRVEITRDDRHVRLASGEAFFAVRKDPERPFVVETPAGSVRVTGTQFAVRTDAAGVFEVTVVQGTVQVRADGAGGRPAAPVSLTAGNQLSAGPAGIAVKTLSAAGVDAALAWRQGQVVLDGALLRDALARFARYHGQGIAASPGAAELRIGGRFSLDDLNGFFSALEEILPVRVTHNLNGTVQVSLRAEH